MGRTANELEDSESKRQRSPWPDSLERVLIRLMVKEVERGNKSTSSFTRKGWGNIEEGFYEKTNKRYNYTQLRNKFNQLKIRYHDFSYLCREPGFIWDPSHNSLSATDAVWKSYQKTNKFTRRFKGKGCPMYNELKIIFDDSREADTKINVGDGSTPSASPYNTSTSKDFQEVDGCSQQRSPILEARPLAEVSIGCHEIAFPSTSSDRRWRTESTDVEGTAMENEEENQEYAGFSITNCVKCLESIEGVDSNTYLKAIKMFKDVDWREIFMAMSTKRRMDWLASLK